MDYPVSQDTGKDLDMGISGAVYVFGRHEEASQLLQETLAERGDVGVGADIPIGDRVIGRLLQLAARKGPRRFEVSNGASSRSMLFQVLT